MDAARTVLLVMDHQVGLLRRMPDGTSLLERTGVAIGPRARGRWARGVGTPVFDDAEFDSIPPTSVTARLATSERRGELHLDAPASQLDPRFDPRQEDISVRKIRVGAFTITDLDDRLHARPVDLSPQAARRRRARAASAARAAAS